MNLHGHACWDTKEQLRKLLTTIVGGQLYQVQIKFRFYKIPFLYEFNIILDYYVLTAAHCLVNLPSNTKL
jgi:hypothetical protein